MKLGAACILPLMVLPCLFGQTDWPVYGHDPGGMRYSPLAQIDVKTVARLRRAWTFHTGEKGRQFESTPIVAGDRMYLSTQLNRIVALEPETGKEIWSYDPKVQRAREHRGVSYWPGDARTPARIVFATGDGRLIALDAATGARIQGFGDNGEVDLRAGVAGKFPSAGYHDLAARDLPRPGDRRSQYAGNFQPRSERRPSRVRHTHRETGLEVSHRASARRARQRDLGTRRLEGSFRAEPVGLDQCGYGARPRISLDRQPRG